VDRPSIVAAVRATLSDLLEQDAAALPEDVRLFEDLGMNSALVLELLAELEDSLGIEMSPGELDIANFRTIGTVTDYLAATAQTQA
jgi:acyl carrier protein